MWPVVPQVQAPGLLQMLSSCRVDTGTLFWGKGSILVTEFPRSLMTPQRVFTHQLSPLVSQTSAITRDQTALPGLCDVFMLSQAWNKACAWTAPSFHSSHPSKPVLSWAHGSQTSGTGDSSQSKESPSHPGSSHVSLHQPTPSVQTEA